MIRLKVSALQPSFSFFCGFSACCCHSEIKLKAPQAQDFTRSSVPSDWQEKKNPLPASGVASLLVTFDSDGRKGERAKTQSERIQGQSWVPTRVRRQRC